MKKHDIEKRRPYLKPALQSKRLRFLWATASGTAATINPAGTVGGDEYGPFRDSPNRGGT